MSAQKIPVDLDDERQDLVDRVPRLAHDMRLTAERLRTLSKEPVPRLVRVAIHRLEVAAKALDHESPWSPK